MQMDVSDSPQTMQMDRDAAIEGLPPMGLVHHNADGSIAQVNVPLVWNLKTCCGSDSPPFASTEVPKELLERGVSQERWDAFATALKTVNEARPVAVESMCSFLACLACAPTLGLSMCAFNKVREGTCAMTWSSGILKSVQDLNDDMKVLHLPVVAKPQSVNDTNLRLTDGFAGMGRDLVADMTMKRWMAFAMDAKCAEEMERDDHCFFVPPSGAIVSGHQFERNARLGCLPNMPPSGNQFCLHPWG
jgi:hypothetical protein